MRPPRNTLERLRAAAPAAPAACSVCGRPGRISLHQTGKAGFGAACSSSCLETLRHRAKR